DEEEDPVDHKLEVETACAPKCEAFVRAYEACATRIESDETGEAHCTGQYFDMYKCVDECAKKEIMERTV
ncbi:ubiquinol-cytochrome C reductase hinge domain-containing protein, partial [Ostreococcus tauri]